MDIIILDQRIDNVIKSNYITAVTTYRFAINHLVPLINRFEQQRYSLRPNFYKKLERDLLNGCIMPPLTLAIKSNIIETDASDFLESSINMAFVLDGIQRLNTLNRLKNNESFNLDRPIYLNILICNSMDKLLYRMITLNNGQKPMSTRHQVEILANNIYDFDNLNIDIQTEKQQKIKRINQSFKKEDIIKGYLAFISNSINIDNQKIIESKLDELITDSIIDSDITDREVEYSDIINLINNFIENSELKKWFLIANNLIGFSAGIPKSFYLINEESADKYLENIKKYEEAFSYIDVSKIKLGKVRRQTIKFFIEKYSFMRDLSIGKITDLISMEI